MKNFKMSFAVLYIGLFFISILIYPQAQQKFITPKAIWNPDMTTMEKITKDCGTLTGTDLENCFEKVMRESGATPQALEFTALMNNDAYMNGFKQLGNVDAALVYYPLQERNHYGCLIVNGLPSMINVDDYKLLPMDELEQDQAYRELAKTYTNIGLFPGDRKNSAYPYSIKLKKKINRVVVNYRLRDGCNSCQLLAFVEFGFDFDSTGKYLGSEFLSFKKTVETGSQTNSNDYNTNTFSDPSQPIDVNKGDKFSIVMVSNHAEGFKWQLAGGLDKNIITLAGTSFFRPYETLPTAPGKEVWYFNAVGSGSTELKFDYVSSWNEGKKTYEKYTFTVNVR